MTQPPLPVSESARDRGREFALDADRLAALLLLPPPPAEKTLKEPDLCLRPRPSCCCCLLPGLLLLAKATPSCSFERELELNAEKDPRRIGGRSWFEFGASPSLLLPSFFSVPVTRFLMLALVVGFFFFLVLELRLWLGAAVSVLAERPP